MSLPDDQDSLLEEQALWQAWATEKSAKIRMQLFAFYTHWIRMLTSIFYRRYPHPLAEWGDYMSLASIGLLQAIDRFDPSRKSRFKSYAEVYVKGNILKGLACYIKDDQAIQERTQSIIDGYIIESEDLGLNEIANIASDLAMGYFIELDSGDSSICNPADVYESTQMIDATTALIALLPDNQRQVIAGHYLHGLSFVEISGLMEISKSRVSQLHNRALKEMRGLYARLNSS
jgi:RNA polymerase sigma factor for flagellar operon FliA